MDEKLEKRDEFIYTVIKERFSVDWARIDTLDGKASGIIGFAGIIISLEGGLGGYLLDKIPKSGSYYLLTSYIFIVGIILLALSIFCALMAYHIKKDWVIVPDPEHLIENYAKKNRKQIDIIRILSWEISKAIKENKKTIDDKVEFIEYSFKFLLLGIAANIIFIYFLLFIT